MKRTFNLIIFIYTDYWRRSRLLFQLILLAFTCGYFFDPRFAPYSLENVVFIKGIFLIITGYLTGYHLTRMNYDRRLYILLNRVKRLRLYLGSILTACLIVIALALLMDIYLLIFSGLNAKEIFRPDFNIILFLIIIISVVMAHLFSVFTVSPSFRILGFIFIGLATIPQWYRGIPFESFFKLFSYLLPPLGYNITALMAGKLSLYNYIFSVIYVLLILLAGSRIWQERSLTNLY